MTNQLVLIIVMLFLQACATAAPAPPPAPRADRFDVEVRPLFFDGFQGNKEALDEGMKKAEEELARNPGNAEALVWHGSGLVFRAGRAFAKNDAKTGMELYGRGRQEMDHAAALAPENPAVRIPRGATYLTASSNMPPSSEATKVLEIGVADYEKILELQRAYLGRLSTHARGQLFYGMADGYQRLGQAERARSYYERLVAEAPESPLVPRARAWLDGKPETDKVTCLGCHVTASR
jgi:tetratricopeptide (TPR) repeat protein